MVISEKCSYCVHNKICSFKGEYLAVCEAVDVASYGDENRFMALKDSAVSISIKCPNMMTQSTFRNSTPQL